MSEPSPPDVQGKSPDRKFAISANWNQIGATSTSSQTQALFLANLQYNLDVNNLSWYNSLTSLYQTPSSIDPNKAYFINGLRQSSWYIQHQNAQLETLATYFYDGDGGRIKKVTPISTTTYIGSIYEVTGSLKTKHIFMGANRVCAVESTGNQFYYHSDHLGSSNIISNKTGVQAGLTEFTPYGSVFTKSGTYDPKYKFTGKELDETGLYFYGARYYDPQLGRFITPDTIVQSPYDLQSLNRYSYCRNNPINLIDPTGHSWKKFWHKVEDWFKDEVLPPLISFSIAFVFSGFNPIAGLAAAMATITLDTGEGRQFVRRTANNVFDDALGMRPGTAYIWSSVLCNAVLAAGYEMALSSLIFDPVSSTKFDANTHSIEGKSPQGKMFGPDAKAAKLSGYTDDKFVALMNGERQVGTLGVDKVSSFGLNKAPLEVLNITHSAIDLVGYTGEQINPLAYGTWGVCHTATNAALLKAGYSSTLITLGQGGWSTYLSTAVYGNYGGGLYRSIYAGVEAYNDNK